ncbi:hypothetical protein MKW94_007563 [Papaver nudicaule]|uniref:MORF/ORRM1/DAG-like MORF domain-containing protein n=1 Tax=Papaver nudicaule TaxID=74823 RepID=A0AA41VF35_PAPNU|nr:hypothetical protein [Papaver nudicaule]
MATAACRRGGSLIIKSIPFSSSYRSLITSSSSVSRSSYSPHLSRSVRLAALTEFKNRFPSITIPGGAAARYMSTISSPSDPEPSSKYQETESQSDDDDFDDGCDYEHWFVVMEPPQGEPTRDEIIDSYVNTLSKVLGSEEEARMKIYSVSTICYFAFGALVSKELSEKIQHLPGVSWVAPDCYMDFANQSYGGEPFINGKAVPYDPKCHEEWLSNRPDREREELAKQVATWAREYGQDNLKIL